METQPVRRPPENGNKPFGLGKGALIIGLLIFVGILFALPRLFGGDDDDSPAQINQPDNAPEQPLSNDVVSAEIGDLVVASSIDNNGCAADRSNSFSTGDTIYIVAEDSDIPASSTLFVRLYANGEAVEDSQELTADDDYIDTCANFLFEPVEGASFDAGEYEAELFVNGNPHGTVSFNVE